MLIPSSIKSWGNLGAPKQTILTLGNSFSSADFPDEKKVLFAGNLRSYGDSCLNSDGVLIDGLRFDKFISFDETTGLLHCEGGVLFSDIIDTFLPRGYFLPVTPGTKLITVAGAVANDVHGKNHHVAGCFGNYVERIDLCRSDKGLVRCTPTENVDLFKATIGGMGLTGYIKSVAFRLKKVPSPLIDVEHVPFGSLEEFKEIEEASLEKYEYSVAWVDCVSRGRKLGRGIFMRGNHSQQSSPYEPKKSLLTVPFQLPSFCLNAFSIKMFNDFYHQMQSRKNQPFESPIDPFFYPLDSIGHWNRIYGKHGFYQYQFVITKNVSKGLEDIFRLITESGQGSFLAVLKNFGSISSPGMMSFPMAGPTLALDFPNRGKKTADLFKRLDDLVLRYDGRLYPAKDSRMSGEMFQSTYEKIDEFSNLIDAKFMSDFWERVKR